MWNNIVNTALLGTGKKQLQTNELPAAIADIANDVLADNTLDAEARFLHLAALAFNYRQSGVSALHQEGVAITPCAPEILPYCTQDAVAALQNVLDMDVQPLIVYWLEACSFANQVAPPEYVPLLMEMALRDKSLRRMSVQVCGKRGEWLSTFNQDWKFSKSSSLEERWQNGSLEARRQALTDMREKDPAGGREWLQQTWAQENANTRAELLKSMSTGLSEEDIPWLESLLAEKSMKVRDEVWPLLKQLPSSGIVQAYWQLLQSAVTLVQEKSMLGLRSKNSLKADLKLPDDKRIADSGIQLLSNTKNVSDDSFILYQLATFVPPSWWEKYLGTDKAGVLALFLNTPATKHFIQALGIAASRFHDLDWTRFIIKEGKDFYKDALEVLPPAEQDAYALQFFEQEPQFIIRHLTARKEEWGLAITREVCRFIANNPYQYNRNFFDKHVRLMPTAILVELDKIEPDQPVYLTTWKNTSDHIRRLLGSKAAIAAAFHY